MQAREKAKARLQFPNLTQNPPHDSFKMVDDLEHKRVGMMHGTEGRDRKSTRLNSSHGYISYAVFCLKKKKKKKKKYKRKRITKGKYMTAHLSAHMYY